MGRVAFFVSPHGFGDAARAAAVMAELLRHRADTLQRRGRLLLLPFHSDHYHPDLVEAADLVVGKLGYSTVAEAYRSGAAFAFVSRPRFPESPVLARFVERHMCGVEIE